MKTKSEVLKYLEIVTQLLPIPVYWLSRDNRLLGANTLFYKTLGFKEDVIGKHAYDVYPEEIASNIIHHDNLVMQTGIVSSQEEKIKDVNTGQIRYFTSIKTPLYDENGIVFGIVGSSVEITAEKELERLRLSQLEEHQRFRKVADQMAHDLGSPLMALSVLTNNCEELAESKRNMLRESISSIREIAGSLLSQYKLQEELIDNDNISEILVYDAIEQIILEKRYEYHNLAVKFICKYEENSKLSFIKGNTTSFKRMLSNLINNAVQAINKVMGFVQIKLDSDSQYIKISIEDNGNGIDQEVINKLINKIPITSGKGDGHGIGFSQIHETLSRINGKIDIESELGQSTTVTLTIPQVFTPEWLAEAITINSDDTIIVLDDDSSIHGAWDIRFEELLQTNPDIKVKHYTKAIDTINYINNLSETEKQHILLLTDYELLKQNFNGLDVIVKTQIKRSILVTSHYNNADIKLRSKQINTKILPKLLASFVPIRVKSNLMIFD